MHPAPPLAQSPPLVGRLSRPSAIFVTARAGNLDRNQLLRRLRCHVLKWGRGDSLSSDNRLHFWTGMHHNKDILHPSLWNYWRSLGNCCRVFIIECSAVRSLPALPHSPIGHRGNGSPCHDDGLNQREITRHFQPSECCQSLTGKRQYGRWLA